MKTNKLPELVWADSQATGSQSQQHKQLSTEYLSADNLQRTGNASNDASYEQELSDFLANEYCIKIPESGNLPQVSNIDMSYKKAIKNDEKIALNIYQNEQRSKTSEEFKKESASNKFELNNNGSNALLTKQSTDIPERVFMNGLIKHTVIALAIIVPLAAFSAYAAPQTNNRDATNNLTTTESVVIDSSNIIHKSATTPTTVDTVDLEQYAGTWYEIGRLPMYFQRNCVSDVTANYTSKTDGSGIIVLNQCTDTKGKAISSAGLAKPADNTGSKLKVTFLPSWIRWLPVGRADYWILARDDNYKTALVGTPDNKYLWLLARSPNISQQTYTKYRQIAKQQGYDLKEFKLTAHSDQTVNLVP